MIIKNNTNYNKTRVLEKFTISDKIKMLIQYRCHLNEEIIQAQKHVFEVNEEIRYYRQKIKE